ncbi:MAG: hypothetical protein LBH39_06610 [Clostridiales Family XIII bacterium]|jgi:hypothetical protein|nr:hypothetical protein [Clostridiales Family XIII bacterium]
MDRLTDAPKGVIDEFYDYLCSVLDVYKEMRSTLKGETAYIDADDIDSLNVALNSQHAMMLKTRGFGDKIDAYLARLGIQADSLSATAEQLPEGERFRFYALLGEFDQTLQDVIFYKSTCYQMLQNKLYAIEKQLAQRGIQDSTTYDGKAGGIASPPHVPVFEKKA